MLKTMFLWGMVFFAAIPAIAQDDAKFVFDNNTRVLDISSVQVDQSRLHPLGLEVTKKLSLLKDQYTYIEEGTPTSPHDKTIVIKPAIYNSIQKLNRYFKKEVKKGRMDVVTASADFIQCLNIALIVYGEDTQKFEDYLNDNRKPEQLLRAFKLVELQ